MISKSTIQSYRDLIVWQKAMVLVRHIYQDTQDFPSREQFGLTQQIRRSAVSTPSNIAEGYGRKSTQDYLRFLQIAVGSLYELQTQIEISKDISFLPVDKFDRLYDLTREIERMLTALVSRISDTT